MLYSAVLEVKATFGDLWGSMTQTHNWTTSSSNVRLSWLFFFFSSELQGKGADRILYSLNPKLKNAKCLPGREATWVSTAPFASSSMDSWWDMLLNTRCVPVMEHTVTPTSRSALHGVLQHISQKWRPWPWFAAAAQVVCSDSLNWWNSILCLNPTPSTILVNMVFAVFKKFGF